MTVSQIEIKGLIESSLIDWPGKIATVAFFGGCNLRCRYCHARDIISSDGGPEGMSIESALQYATSMAGWIDGIVISGGEPTLHGDLAGLCAEIKNLGLAVKIDTNGTRPKVLWGLCLHGLVDAIAMDVKAPLDGRYRAIVGCDADLDAIRDSIRIVKDWGEQGGDYEFRTTVAPSLTSVEDVADIAKAIEGAARYALQPFRPHVCLDAALHELPECPREELELRAAAARPFVENVVIRL